MPVKVYTSPSCASCRKAKKWLNDFGIDYVEKNIFVSKLNREELKAILEKTENGFEDIISTRSKVFKEKGTNLEDMTINELLDFIEDNPSVLKRPIIIDNRRLQIGYNDEEIRVFIPRELRENYNCVGCGYEALDENGECGQFEACKNYEPEKH
ncbi:MAG: transcriptional regulator Spx [Erysipelotrichales bacterium]